MTAALALVLLGSAPAVASTASWSDCPANRFCAWTGLNGTGGIAHFRVGDANLGDGVGPGRFNNAIRSVFNRTTSQWCLYDQPHYQSLLITILPGERRDLPEPVRLKTTSLRPCPHEGELS